ncbi:MAG: nucleotidyl transferase AbiEii/AbiGii toxin family protein [Pseudomonadota bacterium]
MDLIKFFKLIIKQLDKANVKYALAGGLVASIYRTDERLTKDLDFLIYSEKNSSDIAIQIIKEFRLKHFVIRKAQLEGGPMFAIKKQSTPPYIISGKPKKDQNQIGLDFILPQMPWFESALLRAQSNMIDFGFALVPCLTVEDIIISKFYSLQNDSKRFKDLDDLKSIFEANHNLDLAYISGQMQKHSFLVPEMIKDLAPQSLVKVSKQILKNMKHFK